MHIISLEKSINYTTISELYTSYHWSIIIINFLYKTFIYKNAQTFRQKQKITFFQFLACIVIRAAQRFPKYSFFSTHSKPLNSPGDDALPVTKSTISNSSGINLKPTLNSKIIKGITQTTFTKNAFRLSEIIKCLY